MTASASRAVWRAVRSEVPARCAYHEYPSVPPEVVIAWLDRPQPKNSSVGAAAGPQAERRIEEGQHEQGNKDPSGDVPGPRPHQAEQAAPGGDPTQGHVIAPGNRVDPTDRRRESEGKQGDTAGRS